MRTYCHQGSLCKLMERKGWELRFKGEKSDTVNFLKKGIQRLKNMTNVARLVDDGGGLFCIFEFLEERNK